jgi:hypothetical protein
MNKLLLMALVAIGLLVAARADMQVVVSIRNQTAWLEDNERHNDLSSLYGKKGNAYAYRNLRSV